MALKKKKETNIPRPRALGNFQTKPNQMSTQEKPFDITKPVRTRDGRKVEIKFTDGREPLPIGGYIGDSEWLDTWTKDGKFYEANKDDGKDLVNCEWKLPDPPPGREWHRTDFEEEDLPPGYRPAWLGEARRDEDEVLSSDVGWITIERYSRALTDASCTKGSMKTRTKRPLPQEADLTMDDLPHGVELLSPAGVRYIPTLINEDCLVLGGTAFPFMELRKQGWKWRADNGDWQPFWKTI